ncbi:MAG: hypothetical protein H6534_09625 [Chthonomonadaceae bacterium]|nr:hypothetical protein [Chthonomonadaceae bacterium]
MERKSIAYTFANHMHWVDMEWLWGAHVLPGSVRDMLAWCEATGAKGCVNFDGIGYEKLAAEAPEALADLRRAVASGTVEPVGCSYGQPYGLFHGGESNVRQRIYGTRTVRRLLGVWPRAFWEEEFDWFPQLPQMLRGVGMEFASLFFQWTWHTPEVPREEAPAVLWEAPDGSTLVTATRNALNLHQWPEDMDAALDAIAEQSGVGGRDSGLGLPPLIQQWVELMPSPDWMCRSEVLLPAMRRLLEDPRLDISFGTLTDFLSRLDPAGLETRRYGPDQMWHGMTLGKNGDVMRRRSRSGEALLLTAEAMATVAGRLGRPYAQWDVYPTWELEEAWRELLSAQHHDNDECEGLCGHVGVFSYERSAALAGHVRDRTLALLARRVPGPDYGLLVFNPLGWARDAALRHPVTGEPLVVRGVPPMGWKCAVPGELESKARGWTGVQPGEPGGMRCQVGDLRASIDRLGRLSDVRSEQWPEGVLASPALELEGSWDGVRTRLDSANAVIDPFVGDAVVHLHHPLGGRVEAWVALPSDTACVDVTIKAFDLPRPDPGMSAGLSMRLAPAFGKPRLVVDHPYGSSEIEGSSHGVKKYPKGDWMTSPQWFETIEDAFHCSSFVDLLERDGPRGVLVVHDGSQQWFRDGDGVRVLLCAYDPWDEAHFVGTFEAAFRLVPHAGLSPVERRRLAQEFLRPVEAAATSPGGDAPPEFSLVRSVGAGITVEAVYREAEDSGHHVEGYAGASIGYPLVARLVEWNGSATEAELTWGGEVAAAFKTHLLGGGAEPLAVEGATVRVPMRAHEIATVYVDLVEARKQTRDLDAKREVWATVHRR